jgi:hypothetical protein
VAAFWKRTPDSDELDARLRARRAEPRADFVDDLDPRVRRAGAGSRTGKMRLGLGVALSALALAAIGSAGAVNSAELSAHHFATFVKKAVGAQPHGTVLDRAPRGATADHPPRGGQPADEPNPPGDQAASSGNDDHGDHHNPAHHQYHITICHRVHHPHGHDTFIEITIPVSAVPAHARHGDIIPAPPEGCPHFA